MPVDTVVRRYERPLQIGNVRLSRPCLAAVVAIVMLMGSSGKAHAQDNVTIYADSTAQLIRGYGGAYIHFWRPDMTDEEIQTAFGTDDGELGFSILRLGIDPDPNRWHENLNTARKAQDMGVLIFASPWNAPRDMLIQGAELDTVATEKYADYAEHLEAFNQFMRENGVDIYAISVQNEPDYAHDWTGWSPEGMVKFMRENAPTITTKVMAPESFQFRREMSDPILMDSVAASHTDIIGGHIYGGGLSRYPLALDMGKEVWMTEHYVDSQDSGNQWHYAMDTGIEMQRVMSADMSAYVWWYLVRYYGPIADGEVPFIDPTQYFGAKGEVTKKGYVMSQFSRFIRPGFYRVNTSPHGHFSRVHVTAYKDSTQMVVVATNDNINPREVTITLEDAAASQFSRYVTSETQDVERLDDVQVVDNTMVVTLEPGTITTFVSEYRSVSSEAPAPAPSSYRLQPNYPNPFASSTTVGYELPQASEVKLEVFDVLGRRVATLVEGAMPAGSHEVRFDASRLPAGIYVYRLTGVDDVVLTRTMTVVK